MWGSLRLTPIRGYVECVDLHEIFKYAHLNFTVCGRKHTYIHTTSANAVTLVWGSLRLAPIRGYVECVDLIDLWLHLTRKKTSVHRTSGTLSYSVI